MLEKILPAVKEAGALLLAGYDDAKELTYKSEIDLVTQYDVAVENLLKDNLARSLPDFAIVAEESGGVPADRVIYIDPIDGTTNFVHGLPFCAVSVGAFQNGEPVAAAVFNPILDELFTAEKGKGAFLNGKPLKVSPTGELRKSLVATGFPYATEVKSGDRLIGMLRNVLANVRDVRRPGAASLDLCYVAKGTFDGYYELNLKPWDMAAGMLVVTEAGGKVTNGSGGPMDVHHDDLLVATNGTIHDQLFHCLGL